MMTDLITNLKTRYSPERSSVTNAEWVQKHTTLRKRPFSFKGYEFQIAILNDNHPDLTCKKCSQIGLTEIQLRKFLLYLRRSTAMNGIFTLPNEKMFKRVSKGRLKPILDNNDSFKVPEGQSWTRSENMIQFDESFGYITGCTEGDATSINADFMMHDEYDLSPMAMISLFQSRIQGSDWKMTQAFSTPTHIGYGIDGRYTSSDQHELMTRCTACNHYNIPEFNLDHVEISGVPDGVFDLSEIEMSNYQDQLDIENAFICCKKCRSPLDLGNPDLQEWVPKYPTRTLSRGYNVTPFVTSRLDLSYIFRSLKRYQTDDYIRGFHNTVLGKAFTPGNARLRQDDIDFCMKAPLVPEVSDDYPLGIGIDVGQTCHITVGDEKSTIEFITVKVDDLVERVEELMKKYNIVTGCIDRHPYTPTAEAVRDKSGGVILPIEYRGKDRLSIIEDEFQEVSHLQGNRTKMIDSFAKEIQDRTHEFHGYGDKKPEIREHLMDMVRDEHPDKPAVWEKLTGNDHWFHSLVMKKVSFTATEVLKLHRKQDEDQRSTLIVGSTGSVQTKSFGLNQKNKAIYKRF